MEEIMNKINLLPLSLLMVAASVWAGEETEMERPSMYISQTQMVSAVVTMIDHETRVVTVRKDDGQMLTFTASEEARNLGQVSVGDILTAEYEETLSIQVMANEGHEPEVMVADAMARTEEGEMPGGAVMEATVITATVEDINIEAHTFKLRFADGTVNEYVARDPENLKRSKVGDLVVITATTAMAIIVEHQEQAAE
jgi:hypothetical protein